ncbi:hypothetical protein BJY17_001517 [Agromyces hippuratus]|uniref:DNA modification methylase n=1 Tax=Agromyces hippuratus TaxID=286438 RepID=A0A852WWY7_9MICO|nr:hypothetical protein [Agromyces hippuratus]NYG20770.1 hypothetical protein [Agromyces hippuratus]
MKARLAASAALALGIALGASGCSMVTYQATTEHYDASDGVSVDVGELDLRNVLVVSDDGVDGTLVMTVVNNGTDDVTLGVQFGGDDTETIRVEAGSEVVFGVDAVEGTDEVEPIVLEGIDTLPGAFLPMFFEYSGTEGVEKLIPVLDGRLPEYEHLVP